MNGERLKFFFVSKNFYTADLFFYDSVEFRKFKLAPAIFYFRNNISELDSGMVNMFPIGKTQLQPDIFFIRFGTIKR